MAALLGTRTTTATIDGHDTQVDYHIELGCIREDGKVDLRVVIDKVDGVDTQH